MNHTNALPQSSGNPVMDVLPPKPTEAMPVMAAPEGAESVPTGNGSTPNQANHSAKPAETKQLQPTKSPKSPSSGVGLAIFASVVIVVMLASLLTYAYLKTNNLI